MTPKLKQATPKLFSQCTVKEHPLVMCGRKIFQKETTTIQIIPSQHEGYLRIYNWGTVQFRPAQKPKLPSLSGNPCLLSSPTTISCKFIHNSRGCVFTRGFTLRGHLHQTLLHYIRIGNYSQGSRKTLVIIMRGINWLTVYSAIEGFLYWG